jgi:two-component system, LytTR family, sensor kinase
MLPQNKTHITTAALMSLMINLPNVVLLFHDSNIPIPISSTWQDFGLKILFGFLFTLSVLFLYNLKKWKLVEKVLLFSLLYVIGSFIFINIHLLISDVSDGPSGLRIGYFMRNMVLISVAILISDYLKSNREKQLLEFKNKDLEAAQIKAELDTLHQQLNPHFLFNALNSLQSLIREDPDKSQRFVEHLSSTLRYSLDTQKKSLVAFEKELQSVEAYLYLLKIRFGDKLKIEKLNLEKCKGFLPPLALQLLIENAVNHNEVSTEHPLTITITYDENKKMLTISNNLKPKRMPTNGAGLGLYNLNNRYQMLSQKSIEIKKDDHHFEVIIPILANENSHH